MTTIFASDWHGCAKMINKVEKAKHDFPNAETVFGGDYIDGDKNSKEVLEYIFYQYQLNNDKNIFLLGNHEDLLLNFVKYYNIDDYKNPTLWLINGGKTTIKSLFGRCFSKNIAQKKLYNFQINNIYLIDFIQHLKTEYLNQDAAFVHAYLDLNTFNINKAIQNTSKQDKIWSRNVTNRKYWIENLNNKAIVFGHTPTTLFIDKQIENNDGIIKTYDNNDNTKKARLADVYCPVIYAKYNECKPLIACDGGIHAANNINHGNVVVIEKEKVIKVY